MSTVEIPGIEVPDWWTKRTSRLYADRDKLIATEGDAAYQAALSKAMQSDQADMAAHQKAMAMLRSMPQDTPTAAFDAYVEAIKSAETPRVRNRLLKEAVDTAEAGVAYKKLRDTFDNSYGDPARAKQEYAARGEQMQGTLATVLGQLSFPAFLKDYQDARKQAKSPDEAIRNTTLAYGLQALASEGGGVRGVQFELGLPPLAAGEALYRKVSKGHPALDVLEKNRNVPFVSRFLNSAGHAAPLKEDGFDVTHKMAQTDNFAYPTVVEENGKLVDLRGTGRDPFREAMARGDVIQFNSPEEALRFTQHYKEGVDLLKAKDQIVAFGSARDAYVDIARNLQAYATQYVQEHRGTTFDEGVKALQDLLAQAHPKIQELAKGLPEVGGGLGLPPFYVPPEPHRVAQGLIGQTAQTAVGELIRGPITGPLVRALPEGPQRNIEAVGNLMVPPIEQKTRKGQIPIVGGMIPRNYAASVAALTNALSFGVAYRASPAGAIGGAVTGAMKGAVPGAVARLAGAVTAGAVGGAEIPSTIEAAAQGRYGEAARNIGAGAVLGAVGSGVKTGVMAGKAARPLAKATSALETTTSPVRARAEALQKPVLPPVMARPPEEPLSLKPTLTKAPVLEAGKPITPPEAGAVGPGAEGISAPVPPPAAPAKPPKGAKPPSEVFSKSEIEVSKPMVTRRKRANGTDGTVAIDVRAPHRITEPDTWHQLADTDKTHAIVRGRVIFETGKAPSKNDPVWSVWDKNENLIASQKTQQEAIGIAKDYVHSANPPASAPPAAAKPPLRPPRGPAPKSIGSAAASELLSNEPVQGMGTPVDRTVAALKSWKPKLSKQAKLYAEERKQRIGTVHGIGEAEPGEAGLMKQLAAARGPLKKVEFESIRHLITQEDLDSLLGDIQKSPHLAPWQKLRARRALANKVFGTGGSQVLQPGEYTLLSRVFPEMAQALAEKAGAKVKGLTFLEKASALATTTKTMADLGAAFQQGLLTFYRHPRIWAKSYVRDSAKFLKNQKHLDAALNEITSDPDFKFLSKSGLPLPAIEPGLRFGKSGGKIGAITQKIAAEEEVVPFKYVETYAKSKFLPKRLLGNVALASDRSYSGAQTVAQWRLAKHLLNLSDKSGVKRTSELGRAIADQAANSTQRGRLPGHFERHAGFLSSTWFSPRRYASIVSWLNPLYYVKAPKAVRMERLTTALATVGGAELLTKMGVLAGGQEETNPLSSDYKKVRFGKTRVSFYGPFPRYVAFLAQLASGQTKAATTGKIEKARRRDILLDFAENKTKPLINLAVKTAQGENLRGGKLKVQDIPGMVANTFVPMFTDDIIDIARTNPELLPGLAGPAFFGAPIATYPTDTTQKMDDAMRVVAAKENKDEKLTRHEKAYKKAFKAYREAQKSGMKEEANAAKSEADAIARDVLEESK